MDVLFTNRIVFASLLKDENMTDKADVLLGCDGVASAVRKYVLSREEGFSVETVSLRLSHS